MKFNVLIKFNEIVTKGKKNEFKTTLVKKAYVHTHMTTAYYVQFNCGLQKLE